MLTSSTIVCGKEKITQSLPTNFKGILNQPKNIKNIVRYGVFIALSVVGTLNVFAQSKGYNFKVNTKNIANGRVLYLNEVVGNQLNLIDSATIKDNAANFILKQAVIKGVYGISAGDANQVYVVLGEPNLQLGWDLATPEKFDGSKSPENQAYLSYIEKKKTFTTQLSDLDKKANSLVNLQRSNPDKFNAEMQSLTTKYDSITNLQNTFYKNFSESNKGKWAAKVAKTLYQAPELTRVNFFDPEVLNDPEVTRADVLNQKVNQFLIKFVAQNTEAYQQAVEELLNTGAKGAPGREIIFMTLIDLFGNSGVTMPNGNEVTKVVAETWKREFPKSVFAKRASEKLPIGVGDIAKDIVLEDPDGKPIKLSSLKGKVVLLDFWASWCKPCRMENPNVVKVYNKYKDKGFTVFSVSLDNDRKNWLAAIEKDQLTWPSHCSDLKGWSSAGAKIYNVSSIPAAYLIDKDGKIVAKSLRGEALEEKVASLLGK